MSLPPLPGCDFTGLWNPADMVVSAPSVSSSSAEMKAWPRLALGILKLDPKTLRTVDNCEVMNIKHTVDTLTVQHLPSLAADGASAPALSLALDNKPHTFHTAVGDKVHAADLTITACQLDEEDSHDLLIKIEFPPRDKKGVLITKFKDYAEEQLALHRAGYILERSHRSSNKTMTQLVQYHRAPNILKDSKVKTMDPSTLPVVYAITRTYRRVESKEEEEEQQVVKKSNSQPGGGESESKDGSSSSSTLTKPHTVASSSITESPVRSRQSSPGRPSTNSGSADPDASSTPVRHVWDLLVPASPRMKAERSPNASVPASAASSSSTSSSSLPPPSHALAPSALPSSSPSSSSVVAPAASALPAVPSGPLPCCTLSGTWRVDPARSDSLEEMMKVLGVPWLARKVVLKLSVTTKITHDPAQHACTVTDSSSAGEQSTVHQTNGEWVEVKTKEGKTLRMCAREGEEMRGVWNDLPPIPSGIQPPFEPSPTQPPFPSYLPIPFSPSQKTHPFTYGYLWIHSLLTDVQDGELQDVRVLVDRTCMVQVTQVIIARKVVSTTTRYFNKIETAEEKQQGEKEWEEKMEQWRRMQAGSSTLTTTVSASGEDDAGAGDGPTMPGGSTSMTPSNGVSASPSTAPNPNLSGTWSVLKDRSNDLSILLKRMGVPWIYRAFASTLDIKTTISHPTPQQIELKDKSKFGSHIQTLQLNGPWSPVTQYGNKARRGFCRVRTDAEKQSVTIETVFLSPAKSKPRPSPNLIAPVSGANKKAPSGASSSSVSAASSPSQPVPVPSAAGGVADESRSPLLLGEPEGEPVPLLTVEASNSPGPRPVYSDESLVKDDSDATLPAPALGEHSSSASADDGGDESKESLDSSLHGIEGASTTTAGDESKEESSVEEVDAELLAPEGLSDVPLDRSPGHSPLPGEESSVTALPSATATSSVPSRTVVPGSDDEDSRLEGSAPSSPALKSGASTSKASASASSSWLVSSSSAAASVAPTVLPSQPIVVSRSDSDQKDGSIVASSPLVVSSSPGLSPLSAPTPSPPAASASAPSSSGHIVSSRLIDIRVLLDPDHIRQVITYLEYDTVVCVCSRLFQRELSKEEKAAKARLEAEAKEIERKKLQAEEDAKVAKRRHREQLEQAVLNGTPAAANNPPPQSRQSSPAAAPVSVVLPSLVAESAASTSSNSPSQFLNLSQLTPTRAIMVFLLLAALASGSPLLIALVLVAIGGFLYHQKIPSHDAAPGLPLVSPSRVARPTHAAAPPAIPLGGGLTVEVVPLRQ